MCAKRTFISLLRKKNTKGNSCRINIFRILLTNNYLSTLIKNTEIKTPSHKKISIPNLGTKSFAALRTWAIITHAKKRTIYEGFKHKNLQKRIYSPRI